MSNNRHAYNKVSHANLLYNRWYLRTTKSIFSQRLGISYTSTYRARDSQHVGHRHMYSKKIHNLQHTPSYNPRTAKKQKMRFERSYRRIFNGMKISVDANDEWSKKLSMARKKNFFISRFPVDQ
ncbi:hypothetical protein RhiirA4_475965 [Rhizophagus irregularis]|uniref:DUF8211 domain-containing protein n=1 Tax=Rhizophagus irregularis TaxID=588596 RepID=A0A2I1HAV7_9GLOM|nr:hypothetical protein RhiirA4_475965 [Rhizophagus irregularis]